VGQFIATVSPCAGLSAYGVNYSCGTYSYFSAGNAGLFGILGLVFGIAAVVVLYLKVAPNVSITWPMPVHQVLLGVSAATLVCGVLVVLMQLAYGLGSAPVTMWLADVLFVGGGAVQTWFAYQEYLASKTAV
jgi:hypothetical protein